MTTTKTTGRERIEVAAAAAGWTARLAHPSDNAYAHNTLVWDFIKPNSKRRAYVYFGLNGQVISASVTTASKVRNVLGTGKAEQVVAFIEGAAI